jgi:hypothetical protein
MLGPTIKIYLISYLCFVDVCLFVLKHHHDDLKQIETCWSITEL